MPIYEYQCRVCGHELETMQRISEPPLKQCPSCGDAESLQRLISQTSFVLKGSGWYVTDYARKGAPASGASGGETTSNGSSSSKNGSASSKTGSGSEKKAAAADG